MRIGIVLTNKKKKIILKLRIIYIIILLETNFTAGKFTHHNICKRNIPK